MRIFVDLDDTVADFRGSYQRTKQLHPAVEWPQSMPGFFLDLHPLPGAIEGLLWPEKHPEIELHILSAPSCRNPHSYQEKRIWVEQHFGYELVRRFHLSPNKGLFREDILIDDCVEGKGQDGFEGTLIQFGSKNFPDWGSTLREIQRMLLVQR